MTYKDLKKKRNKYDLLITLGAIVLYILTFIVFKRRESNRFIAMYFCWINQINLLATFLHSLTYEFFISDISRILREDLVVTYLRMKKRRSLAFNLSILCSCLVFFICQIGSIVNSIYMIFHRFEWFDFVMSIVFFIVNALNFINIYGERPLKTWIGGLDDK